MKQIQMSNQHSKEHGFSLIELLLYVGVVTIIFSAVFPLIWSIQRTNVKVRTNQEVTDQLRYLTEQIHSKSRIASDVIATSSTGVNLAQNATAQFLLTVPAPNNPTIFRVSNGVVYMREGTQPEVAISGSQVRVTNLTFTVNTATDSSSKQVRYAVTGQSSFNTTRSEYQKTQSIQGSAVLRNF